MRFDGKLKSWNDERGFGFIEPELGGQEVFVHIKSFPHGTGRPGVGLPLSFEVEQDMRGKKRAKQVEFIRTPGHKSTNSRADMPAPWTFVRVMAIPVFIGAYAAVSMAWGVKPLLMLWVVLWYVVVSTVAFFAYALDKSTAKKKAMRRTPESTLHFFALAGGWPGALLAQQLLRHKSSKETFLETFWVTVIANVAMLVAFHSPWFSAMQSLIGNASNR